MISHLFDTFTFIQYVKHLIVKHTFLQIRETDVNAYFL